MRHKMCQRKVLVAQQANPHLQLGANNSYQPCVQLDGQIILGCCVQLQPLYSAHTSIGHYSQRPGACWQGIAVPAAR
jgi:hypothetical protein